MIRMMQSKLCGVIMTLAVYVTLCHSFAIIRSFVGSKYTEKGSSVAPHKRSMHLRVIDTNNNRNGYDSNNKNEMNDSDDEGRVKCYTANFNIPYYRKLSNVERVRSSNKKIKSTKNNSNMNKSSSTGVVTVLEFNMQLKQNQREKVRMRKQMSVSRVELQRQRKTGKLDKTWIDIDSNVVGKYWTKRFYELLSYRDKHGDCLVPRFYADNVSLGSWVFTQRQQYRASKEGKKSTMTDERVRLLESVGFVWIAHVSFEKRLQELEEYRNQFGDCNVPQLFETNIGLGSFVNKCRHEYKRFQLGKKSTMNRDRIIALERLGFVWDMKQNIMSWDDRLNELKRFKIEHGTTDVPQNLPSDHPYRSLGLWVKNQRYQYRLAKRGDKSSLTEERIKILEDENFAWESRS